MQNVTSTPASTIPSDLDDGLRQLLAAWTTHDDLRRCGAPIADLAVSSERLFGSRLAIRSVSRAA